MIIQAQKDYQQLHALSRQNCTLQGVSQLMEWDQETYMPPGGAPFRAEQLKVLAGIIHKQKTSKVWREALSKLIDLESGEIVNNALLPEQEVALKRWRRDYLREIALPVRFVEDFAKLCSESISAWRSSKKENAFHQFSPYLERILQMCRQKADLIGYEEHPYDALLDIYEPEAKSSQLVRLFSSIREPITELIQKIQGVEQPESSFLNGKFSHDQQMSFAKLVLDAMGFSPEHGRVDLSTHPFSSTPHPSDSRITTRLSSSIIDGISIILHEGGHSLYAMGLPEEHYGSPLGEAVSLGIHESQSRFWETRIGQSKGFWSYFLPLLQEHFKGRFVGLPLEKFYRAINKVTPSLIRVEADEVTYNLHVILRFELELALLEGKLSVRDLPEAWNSKMKEFLGIVPAHNREGCLQDIHWSMGAFGYFPTYTLGNLYAAHLFKGFEKDYPDWEDRLAMGDLQFIKKWLSQAVYRHGRRYNSLDLLKIATGEPFSFSPFLEYLYKKYGEVYCLK